MEISLLKRLQNSIDYIEKNLQEKIVLETLADLSFMSLSGFYGIFSQMLGTKVKDYIRKRRLSKSAMELIDTQKSITEIALTY